MVERCEAIRWDAIVDCLEIAFLAFDFGEVDCFGSWEAARRVRSGGEGVGRHWNEVQREVLTTKVGYSRSGSENVG